MFSLRVSRKFGRRAFKYCKGDQTAKHLSGSDVRYMVSFSEFAKWVTKPQNNQADKR